MRGFCLVSCPNVAADACFCWACLDMASHPCSWLLYTRTCHPICLSPQVVAHEITHGEAVGGAAWGSGGRVKVNHHGHLPASTHVSMCGHVPLQRALMRCKPHDFLVLTCAPCCHHLPPCRRYRVFVQHDLRGEHARCAVPSCATRACMLTAPHTHAIDPRNRCTQSTPPCLPTAGLGRPQ